MLNYFSDHLTYSTNILHKSVQKIKLGKQVLSLSPDMNYYN